LNMSLRHRPRALSPALLAVVTVVGLAGQRPAFAAGTIDIELNRLQQVEGACRLIVVFTNRLDVPIASLEVETVLFDQEGRAERFLVLKSQPLATQKIRVHQYDLADMSCAGIGSVLINDVVGCEGEGLTPALCLESVAASSREKATLFLSAAEAPTPVSSESLPQ
jgi:hypothetical protein